MTCFIVQQRGDAVKMRAPEVSKGQETLKRVTGDIERTFRRLCSTVLKALKGRTFRVSDPTSLDIKMRAPGHSTTGSTGSGHLDHCQKPRHGLGAPHT